MTNEVFRGEVKTALENAVRLKGAGEDALSRELCLLCAKQEAKAAGEDLLILFYGKGVYDKLNDASDAARYIFIAKCAERVYHTLKTKKPASDRVAPWATRGAVSPVLAQILSWLTAQGRTPEVTDSAVMKDLLRLLLSGEPVSLAMSSRIEGMPPLEIVRGLTEGRIKLSRTGELK